MKLKSKEKICFLILTESLLNKSFKTNHSKNEWFVLIFIVR